jgi:hypothetical protein
VETTTVTRGDASGEVWRSLAWLAALGLLVATAAGAGGAAAGPPASGGALPPGQEADPANVETPVLPRPSYRDVFRLRLQSGFAPGADLGAADLDAYRPELRLRATLPLPPRAVLQLTVRTESSLYDVDGADPLAAALGSGPERFHGLDAVLQGGFLLTDRGSLFFREERWSVLFGLSARTRWQGNAFGAALEPGLALGLGLETEHLRASLGVRAAGRLGRSGFSVSPVADLRLRVGERLTLRSRGLGAQVELLVDPRLELFAAAYEDSATYLLSEDATRDGSLTFEDRSFRAGVGFEWRLAKLLRLNLEAGAQLDRTLEVDRVRGPRLAKLEARGPGAYAVVRIEIRP